MGRLIVIDSDKLDEILNEHNTRLTNNIISIFRKHSIAMLTELDNKIMEEYIEHMEVDWHDIIQQKINELNNIKEG